MIRGLLDRGLDREVVELGISYGLPGRESTFRRFFPRARAGERFRDCWVATEVNRRILRGMGDPWLHYLRRVSSMDEAWRV